MLFTENMRRLMQEHGYNATDLARRSGVSRPYISLMLAGERNPTVEVVEKIAHGFGLEAWQMIAKGAGASGDIDRLMRAYQSAGESDKDMILRVAEQSARFQEGR